MTRPMFEDTNFKFGLFPANCSSGMAITKAPDRWSGSSADTLRMAKTAGGVEIEGGPCGVLAQRGSTARGAARHTERFLGLA